MALTDLFSRRKRGGTRKDNGSMPGTDKLGEPKGYQAGIKANPFQPGTSAFGLEAARRKEQLRRGGRTDLRVKTAAKTVTTARDLKNKYLAGD